MNPGIMPGARLTKEEVNYRPLEKCGLCMYYYQAGRCEVVDGNISPETVCNKFALRPPESPYRDKEFFQKEYERRSN